MFINFGFFSRPYSLIKGPTFIKFWNFSQGLQMFSSLLVFCNINLHILFMPYFYSRPYIYSFWHIFHTLLLFPALRLFRTLEYKKLVYFDRNILIENNLSNLICMYKFRCDFKNKLPPLCNGKTLFAAE